MGSRSSFADSMRQLREGQQQRTPQAEGSSPGELSDFQRLVVQNLFDSGSQLKRREAYFKKLGFQMNPKDPNQYRPIGGGEYLEVDPGFGAWKSMLSEGEYIKAAHETFKDAGDILFDTGSGVANLGSRIAGGVAGAAASVPTSAGLGAPGMVALGSIMAGSAGNALAEGVKTKLGDIFIDSRVPVDKESLILESLISGVMPEALRGIAKSGAGTLTKTLARGAIVKLSAAKNAIEKMGTLDKELMDDIVRNPLNYTKEKLSKGVSTLRRSYKDLFGIEEGAREVPKDIDFIRPDSVFGKMIAPLKDASDKEIARLDGNPNAQIRVADGVSFFQGHIDKIKSKLASEITEDDTAAINYLQKKIRALVVDAKKMDPSIQTLEDVAKSSATLKYSQARAILSAAQKDLNNIEVKGTPVLQQVFGGGAEGLRTVLDNIADRAGSDLPKINKQLSKTFDIYKNSQLDLTGDKLKRSFLGTDNDAKDLLRTTLGNVSSVAKENKALVQNLNINKKMGLDENIPTEDFLNKFRSESLVAKAQDTLEREATRGSNTTIGGALEGGWKGASLGAGTGFGIGASLGGGPAVGAKLAAAGAVAGGAQGAIHGALAQNPKIAIKSIQGAGENALDRLGAQRYSDLVSSGIDPATGMRLGEGIGSATLKAPVRGLRDFAQSVGESAQQMYSSPFDSLGLQALGTMGTQMSPMLDSQPDESRTIYSGEEGASSNEEPESFASRFKKMRGD